MNANAKRTMIRVAIAIVFYASLALAGWAFYVDWFAALLALVAAFGVLTAAAAFKGAR